MKIKAVDDVDMVDMEKEVPEKDFVKEEPMDSPSSSTEPMDVPSSSAEPSGDKRSLENISPTILNKFSELGNLENESRLSSTLSLIELLQESQNKHLEQNPTEENQISHDLAYALKRLIFGLSSPRIAARRGFFVTLVETLHTFPVVETKRLESLINEIHLKGEKEQKDELIGLLLSYCSIVRSGRKIDKKLISTIINLLCTICERKPSLECFCISILKELLENTKKKRFGKIVFPILEARLTAGWESATPLTVWILFITHRLFPTEVNKKFLAEHWEGKSLVMESNYQHILDILVKSTIAHPKLHPVCLEIIDAVLLSNNLQTFWTQVIDNELVLKQTTKTYLAFELFKAVLPRLQPDQVEIILSTNILQTYIKNAGRTHQLLHLAASNLTMFLANFVKTVEEPSVQFFILKRVLEVNNVVSCFGFLAKQLDFDPFIKNLKTEAVKMYTDFLIEHFTGHTILTNNKVFEVQISAEKQLSTMLSHPAMQQEFTWQVEIVKLFFLHSFFRVQKPDGVIVKEKYFKEPLDLIVVKKCYYSFMNGLNKIFLQKNQSSKHSLKLICDSLYKIVSFANSLIELDDVKIISPFDEKTMNSWKNVFQVVKNLRTNHTDKRLSEVFQAILMYTGLMLFVEPNDAVPVIEDLQICCTKALFEDLNPDDIPWIEVIVDLFLSLLAQSQHLTRIVVKKVFSILTPQITPKALKQICDVIDTTAADNAEESEEDSDSEESDVKDNNNDIAVSNGRKSDKTNKQSPKIEDKDSDDEQDNDDEDDTSEEEEDVSEDEEETVVNSKLKKNVQIAMASNEDLSDIPLSDADPEELDRLDKVLAETFQANKKGQDQKELMAFRLRCLDLLDVIIKNHPSIDLLFPILLTLINTINSSEHNKIAAPLLNRMITSLGCITHAKKVPGNMITAAEFSNIMLAIDSKITKVPLIHRRAAETAVSSVAFAAVQFAGNKDVENSHVIQKEDIYEVFKQIMTDYFTRAGKPAVEMSGSGNNIGIFQSFMGRCLDFCNYITNDMVEFILNDDVKFFKKTKAFIVFRFNIVNNYQIVSKWSKDFWKDLARKIAPFITKNLVGLQSKDDVKPLYVKELLSLVICLEKRHHQIFGTVPRLIPVVTYERALSSKMFPGIVNNMMVGLMKSASGPVDKKGKRKRGKSQGNAKKIPKTDE